ncbi:fibroblast growth factor 21 [Thalassophryne amazonica]|uniref:fibroblast growth factor 21 n=1 Tax=Thalassophryne amazonica TaxID=390379 RepID=UPI001471022F|nr:fibroblast growth factor 21 [Thalassophryne amazonica]
MSMFGQNAFFFLTFFLSSILFSFSFYITDSNPLLSFTSQVRETHLYTENHRRGLFLQMTPDGRVSGSTAQNRYSLLELKSVQLGQVAIKGQAAARFLCMDGAGRLRGQMHYAEADCAFRELLMADGYTRFLSSYHGRAVSLASKHSLDHHSLPFTRFLPLTNTLTAESMTQQPTNNQEYFNVDSGDPLGMGLNSLLSPQFSVDK